MTKVNDIAHDTGKGTHKFDVLYDQFLIPGGVNLLLETTATELIQDGGAVAGVSREAGRHPGHRQRQGHPGLHRRLRRQ